MLACRADGHVGGQFSADVVDLVNLQGAFAVGAALLGPTRPRGKEDVSQTGHQAEGAGVDGLDAVELLLPSLAQPAAAKVMGAQALVEVAPEGQRAVLVALR